MREEEIGVKQENGASACQFQRSEGGWLQEFHTTSDPTPSPPSSARNSPAESPANVGRLAAAATYGHAVVVLGGVAGLEYSVQGDARLEERGVQAAGGAADGPCVADLFDAYVNVCPTLGSNTIRTEEALLIALASLAPALGL